MSNSHSRSCFKVINLGDLSMIGSVCFLLSGQGSKAAVGDSKDSFGHSSEIKFDARACTLPKM